MPSLILMLNNEDDMQPKISLVAKLMLLHNLTRAMLQPLHFPQLKKKSAANTLAFLIACCFECFFLPSIFSCIFNYRVFW